MKRLKILFLAAALLAVSCATDGTDTPEAGRSVSGEVVFVEGGLTWPGDVFPADFRVVAVNRDTGERLEFGFDRMSRDKKYPHGVGYRIPLTAGTWRIRAESPGKRVMFLPEGDTITVGRRSLAGVDLFDMKPLK